MTGAVDIPRPFLAVAAIGYEDSPICAATADYLRALLDEVEPALLASTGLSAFSATPGELLRWLRGRGDPDTRRDSWNVVRDRLVPFLVRRDDDVRLPECVLILPAQRLSDDGARQALAADLALARELFGCFLLMFLDEEGTVAPLHDADLVAPWLATFFPVLPARVAMYVLSITTPEGEPIADEDVCRLSALAIAADLVVPHESAHRVLSDRPGAPVITLGTFGGRALQFDHGSLADRLQGRLITDLMSRTVLQEASDPSGSPAVPAPPSQLLLKATPRDEDRGVTVHLVDGAVGGFAGQPAVVGVGFRATASFGGLARQLHLDRTPRRQWVAQLHEWDLLLRDGILPPLLGRVSTLLAKAQLDQLEQVREYLATTFASAGGAHHAQAACEAVTRRTTELYAARVVHENVAPLGVSLDTLRRDLARIPHLPSLILRAAMLMAVPTFVLVLLMLAGDISRWRPHVQWTLLLLIVIAPILAAIARVRWVATAATTRDRAIDDAERRCQLRYAHVAESGLATVRATLLQELTKARERIDAMLQVLRSAGQAATQNHAETTAPLFRPLPERRDDDRYYEALFGEGFSGAETDLLVTRFLDCVRSQTLNILDDSASEDSLGDTVRAFARTETLRGLRTRFRLWQLLRHDLDRESGAPNPEVARRHLTWLVDGGAIACWQGRAVEHALLDPHAVLRAFIAPRVLQPVNPDESQVGIEIVMPDVIAAFWRVTLATFKGDAGGPPRDKRTTDRRDASI